MKKIIVIALLFSINVIKSNNNIDPKIIAFNTITSIKSPSNHEAFKGLAQGLLANYNSFNHYHKNQKCPFNCPKEKYIEEKCTNEDHIKRALKAYSLQILDGITFGIKNYLILSHLYNQGIENASAQIGINLIANEAAKKIIDNTTISKNSRGGKILCKTSGSALKYSFKYVLKNHFNAPSSLLYEPHKMIGLAKGCMINSGAHFTNYNIDKLGNHILKNEDKSSGQNEYTAIKNNLQYNTSSIFNQGVGAIIGGLIAKYLLEDKLNDFAKLVSEQIKEQGPELISKLVSLTK